MPLPAAETPDDSAWHLVAGRRPVPQEPNTKPAGVDSVCHRQGSRRPWDSVQAHCPSTRVAQWKSPTERVARCRRGPVGRCEPELHPHSCWHGETVHMAMDIIDPRGLRNPLHCIPSIGTYIPKYTDSDISCARVIRVPHGNALRRAAAPVPWAVECHAALRYSGSVPYMPRVLRYVIPLPYRMIVP